jgi:hypothetical protein
MEEKTVNTTIFLSGGAVGADTIFQNRAHEQGFLVQEITAGYSFSTEEIQHQKNILTKVNKIYLHRTYPTNKSYINRLLERNAYIAFRADIMYVIGLLNDNIVSGGTAWACYVFIHKYSSQNSIPLYLFDQMLTKWYTPSKTESSKIKWYEIHVDDIPKPNTSKKYTYAGIWIS